jgi:hypothetical protein
MKRFKSPRQDAAVCHHPLSSRQYLRPHLNQDTAIMFHSAFIQTFATRAVVAPAVAPIVISQPTT